MVPNLPNTMTHTPIPWCWETRSIVSIDQLQKASKNHLFSTTRLVVPVYYIFLLEFLQQMLSLSTIIG